MIQSNNKIRKEIEPLLDSIRALDLTDEKGLFSGKILANLGVEVIKVERPGGDHTRMLGPFCDGEVSPERSLYTQTEFCSNKHKSQNLV
jgi:crotonobetainyl-CoA:carnitine CoA-transferase CaiB-like acyl-CoA transferase